MRRHRPASFVSSVLRIAALFACLLVLAGSAIAVAADEDSVLPEDAIGMEMTRSTLAKFKFEGLSLSTTEDQFLRKFPSARPTDDQIDDAAGLQCYTVSDLKSADSAQFYFIGGKLYQIEIEYDLPRLEAQGGLEAVVRKIVKDFGRPDGVLGNRRTWQQPNVGYRADFYTSRQAAQLVVTNTRYSALIDKRQKRTALEEDVELGF